MKHLFIFVPVIIFLSLLSCNSESNNQQETDQQPRVTFQENETDKTVDVLIGGQHFTSLRWQDNLTKPVLFPIHTARGTQITRGFPIDPQTGERADHPHQIGNWLTYGNVNGIDFWGNGSKGLGTTNANGGIIQFQSVDEQTEGIGEGSLKTSSIWIDTSGEKILNEMTTYHFRAEDSVRIIDREVTLTAGTIEVSMADTKEGMFGIRVARELELPAQGAITLYSASGNAEKISENTNKSVSGNYLSSTGEEGIGVWGTRAQWMNLYGNIDGEEISIVMIDHPQNLNYPTWWHARGYGLFSANPLGAKDFTDGEEEVNFTLSPGESITFRYRLVISSGKHLSVAEIERFAEKYSEF